MGITELSQGNLDGLKKQVCECIEHAQAEGYKRGYTKGKNDGHAQGCHTQSELDKERIDQAKQEGYDTGYDEGLKDLTHAMKVYFPLNSEERLKHFGINTHVDNYAIGNPKDLIAKAKAYEEKKKSEEEIKVGDEVYLLDYTNPILITRVSTDGLVGFSKQGKYAWYSYQERADLHKTGRHFDEIEQLLDKLRGDK